MNSIITSTFGSILENARQFLQIWRMGGQTPAASGSPADRGVLPWLAIIAIIALTAWLADARIAIAAREVPFVWQRIFSTITQIGWSGYLFTISGILAIAAPAAALTGNSLQARTGLILLAHRAVLVFVVLTTSGIAAQVIKHLVGRGRPRLMEQYGAFHFDMFSLKATLASFPSGHTITAFAMAWTMALFLPRLRWPLYIVACLVGISRVVIGAHYPSDVLAGAAIGTISAILTARAFARRHIAVEFSNGGMSARGRGLVTAALRASFQAGKARA